MAADPTDPLQVWALVDHGIVIDAHLRMFIRAADFNHGDWRPLYDNLANVDRRRYLVGDAFTDEVLDDRVLRTFDLLEMSALGRARLGGTY